MMNTPIPPSKPTLLTPAALRTGCGVFATLAVLHSGAGYAQVEVLQAPAAETVVVPSAQKSVDLRRALIDVRDVRETRGSRSLSAEERVTLHQQWRAAMRGAYRDGDTKDGGKSR